MYASSTEGCDVLRVPVIIILHPARSQRPSAIYFDLYSSRKRVTAYGKKMRCSSILLLLSTNQYAAVSRVNGKWQYYKSVQLFSPILLSKKEKYPVRIFKKREKPQREILLQTHKPLAQLDGIFLPLQDPSP